MKQRPDLNELSKEVFNINKAKGFHDEYISNETLLMLVITELSEAVEAHRKDKRANVESFDFGINDVGADFIEAFEYCIKDTIEDELADTVIRLLDLAGLREIRITTDVHNKTYIGTFPENIYDILRTFTRPNGLGIKISVLIRDIEDLCIQMEIDLWMHVNLKLLYNQTRPHKHNKVY